MNYSLSGQDIMKLMKDKTKIISYKEINKFKSIDELLYPFNSVFILYESKKNSGHWTVLFKLHKKEIEFFDSYGLNIDDELKFINKEFRKNSNQLKTLLTRLLLKDFNKYIIHYNNYQFQKFNSNIATCGRWCIFRLLNKKLYINEFYNKICNIQLDKDYLVCQFIEI